ncbi:MAG: ATP-binding protein [Pseudomonadales bacterium]|nr:ATP-binding protein [Pseudomonadales bacterium]
MESINECVRGTQRVEDIILNLRDFTTGEQESRKLLDVNTLVRETVDLANAELKHSVNFHLELGEVPGIYGCKGQLKQVLINLITNASHAMDGEGDIYIKTCAEEEGAAIEVIDSGPGIEPENINRLFDPFFTTRNVGTGTGLGLYICHGIVAKHDGEISVENTPTEGACFRIRLPASMRGSERD